MLPNDEFALYGGDYRLRVLTGGFSPDRLTGVTPDRYGDFFRVHATGADGSTVLLTEVGVDYDVAGGTLRVVDPGDPARTVPRRPVHRRRPPDPEPATIALDDPLRVSTR